MNISNTKPGDGEMDTGGHNVTDSSGPPIQVNVVLDHDRLTHLLTNHKGKFDSLYYVVINWYPSKHATLTQSWASVEDDGPTLTEPWVNVSCLLK